MKQEEILNGQVGETMQTGKNEPLWTATKVPNTPFTMVEHEDKFFVTMGKYKLSDDYENLEEAMRLVDEFNWDFILRVLMVVAEDIFNHKTNNKA